MDDDDRSAELDDVARTNGDAGILRGDALTADAHAVHAAEIFDVRRVSAEEAGMAARYARQVDHELAVAVTTERHALIRPEKVARAATLPKHEDAGDGGAPPGERTRRILLRVAVAL